MEKEWKKDPSVFNESYFRELIAKAIIFSTIRKTILSMDWYKENKGYLIQIVIYTFSKLIYETKKLGRLMNYRYIWDKQELPEFLINDIARLAFSVRVFIVAPNHGNIETYCKNKDCWSSVQDIQFELSDSTKTFLVSKDDVWNEKSTAKRDQKFNDGISVEVQVFQYGDEYWSRLLETGTQQGLLNGMDIQLLELTVEYCKGSRGLPQSHFRKIMAVRDKLKDAQVQV
jgi:hypothetical protein